jgi:uncharacterized integral membrane protein
MTIVRRLLVLALFAGAFAATWQFVGRNAAPVDVDFWFRRTPSQPLWLVLLASFALGALAAGLALTFRMARLSLLARRYRRAVAALESEVHQLRNLPLAADGADLAAPGGPPAVAGADARRR